MGRRVGGVYGLEGCMGRRVVWVGGLYGLEGCMGRRVVWVGGVYA